MSAPLTAATDGPKTKSSSRLTTLVVMGVTAVIIAGVAFLANQPAPTAAGVNPITLTGDTSGAAPEIGKAAPDFTATTVDGQTVKLSDYKGKPVWLTFGASWCQPCRAENPDIQATVQKEAGTDLVVLAVFISEDSAAVKEYADRVGLSYLKVPDPNTQIASQYRILGIPSHFFIDRTGILHQMKIGSLDPAAMEAAVKEILG